MKLRKLFAAGLALVMTLAMAAPTMAATITVEPAVKGQTYTAYKIFDVTKAAGSGSTEGNPGYAYTISNNSEWFSVVKAYADDAANGLQLTLIQGSNPEKYNVGVQDAFNAIKFSEMLNDNKDGKTGKTATGNLPKGADKAKAVIDGLEPGYYFVDSSLGSLCILNTTTDTVTVKEKNQEPIIDKKISENSDGTYSVGDKIPYTVTVTAGGNAETSYVVTDTMSASLTFNDDIKIMVGETDITNDTTKVTIAKPAEGDTFTFKITFAKEYVATLAKDTKIVITYSATLNEKSVQGIGANNKAILNFGSDSSVEQNVEIKNYKASFIKVDGTTKAALAGVTFKLTDNAGNEIKLVDLTNGLYRVAMAGEATAANITTPANGVIEIQGLRNGTYKLVELSTLSGYNLLAGPVEFTIENANNLYSLNAVGVTDNNVIENNMGTLLPSTGGMGTTLFYIVGGLMVVCAGVVLVTKKRMGNK